jgi:hypothetical protein
MMPAEPEQTGPPPMTSVRPPAPPAEAPPESNWYHKVWAVLLITFCLEIGLFLLIFPWTEAWDNNYFANSIARIRQYWDNMYLRGAVSGLGIINLYISASEALRLRRFAKR